MTTGVLTGGPFDGQRFEAELMGRYIVAPVALEGVPGFCDCRYHRIEGSDMWRWDGIYRTVPIEDD